jgi:hypothetical protein
MSGLFFHFAALQQRVACGRAATVFHSVRLLLEFMKLRGFTHVRHPTFQQQKGGNP